MAFPLEGRDGIPDERELVPSGAVLYGRVQLSEWNPLTTSRQPHIPISTPEDETPQRGDVRPKLCCRQCDERAWGMLPRPRDVTSAVLLRVDALLLRSFSRSVTVSVVGCQFLRSDRSDSVLVEPPA